MSPRLRHFSGQEVGARAAVRCCLRGGFVIRSDGLRVDWHPRALHAPVVSLISVNDHAEHARRRRTWTRGFSPAALKDYEEIVKERAIQLTETLSARKSVDLARVIAYFT